MNQPKLGPEKVDSANIISESGGRLNTYAAEPAMEIVSQDNIWGFHTKAEKVNGRYAMIGFIAIILIEIYLEDETIVELIIHTIKDFI